MVMPSNKDNSTAWLGAKMALRSSRKVSETFRPLIMLSEKSTPLRAVLKNEVPTYLQPLVVNAFSDDDTISAPEKSLFLKQVEDIFELSKMAYEQLEDSITRFCKTQSIRSTPSSFEERISQRLKYAEFIFAFEKSVDINRTSTNEVFSKSHSLKTQFSNVQFINER